MPRFKATMKRAFRIALLAAIASLPAAFAHAEQPPASPARAREHAEEPPLAPFESPEPAEPALLDELVAFVQRELDILPAYTCSDAVFLRRAYLDVIGTLPTPREVQDFLDDPDPEKRPALIDELMERDEFADCWALKWGDLLRVKAEFPINLWPNGVQAYHRFIHESIRTNKPYDRFVRELLTSSGSNYRVPAVNFYRAIQGRGSSAIAGAVALTFMGARWEKWPPERRSNLEAFFSRVSFKGTAEWKEEIVFLNPAPCGTLECVFPDGSGTSIPEGTDPRRVFADWLISPRNQWFSRNIVNRVWSWLMGRGIIHEPDDLRPDNPPSNPYLLAYLEWELARGGFDLRRIFRLILNSRTWQQSSIPRSIRPEAGALFAYYPVRQHSAEVLGDMLRRICGVREDYVSMIPEPFTFIPADRRCITLSDGSITSPFLELFGRPPRDTGLESERNSAPSDAQRLFLLNSSGLQKGLAQSRWLRNLAKAGMKDHRRVISMLYLTILSREPTRDEIETVEKHFAGNAVKGQDAAADLAWALINTKEFLCRH